MATYKNLGDGTNKILNACVFTSWKKLLNMETFSITELKPIPVNLLCVVIFRFQQSLRRFVCLIERREIVIGALLEVPLDMQLGQHKGNEDGDDAQEEA